MSTAIGEALRRERIRRGENQRQVANRFGVSQPSYFRWESGETLPSDEFRTKVADFLGLTGSGLYELIHGEAPSSFSSLSKQVQDHDRDIAEMRGRISDLEAALEALTVRDSA